MRRMLGIWTLACVVVAGLTATPSASAGVHGNYLVYAVSADTFSWFGASATPDPKADGDVAVKLREGDSIWRTMVVPKATSLFLYAKGTSCPAPAGLVVTIDGEQAFEQEITSAAWRRYTAPVEMAAGSHAVGIGFANNKLAGSACERSILLDTIQLRSDVPANLGETNSVCARTDAGYATVAPPPGYSTSALGTAPGYYEWAAPKGNLGLSPKGVMMLIHGGGWFMNGPGPAATMRSRAERWRAHGWAVVNVSSNGSCGHWIDDMLWFYDRIRAVAQGLPICTTGVSNGGHLALMVAARRPTLHCAISEGGPTDLVRIEEERAFDPRGGDGQSLGPHWVHEFAIAAFGRDNLTDVSPVHFASKTRARILAVLASTDPFVPAVQVKEYKAALDRAAPGVAHKALLLEPGRAKWIHGSVSERALAALWRAETTIAGP